MENNLFITLGIYLAFYIVALFVSVFILRWAFRINQIVRYQKAQAIILGKMAERSGIPKDEIEVVLSLSERID